MNSEIKMSSNAWEFIRQCKQERNFRNSRHIFQEALRLGNESGNIKMYGDVLAILGSENDFPRLIAQRNMVRELATEMLGKIIYTQKEFAGKLIALMSEFGVGVAITSHNPYLNKQDPTTLEYHQVWEVTVYSPEEWGVHHEFDNRDSAQEFANKINNYGNFKL